MEQCAGLSQKKTLLTAKQLNSDMTYRNAKPGVKPWTITVGDGLSMIINPNGSKWWRFRYFKSGKANMLSVGVYPKVSLINAKRKAAELRELVDSGADPSEKRKAQKVAKKNSAVNSFEVVAREWVEKRYADKNPRTKKTALARLAQEVFPKIGKRPVAELTAPEFLTILREVEEQGKLETANRLKSLCSMVMRYAVATGRATIDPVQTLRGAIKTPKVQHNAAITDPEKFGELLLAIDCYQGKPAPRCALRIAPYVFVRPGELREAKWADIDLEKAEWRYTATKTDTPHIVPLATQVVEILRDELKPLTGNGVYVFPSPRNKIGWTAQEPKQQTVNKSQQPMDKNAIRAALIAMGYTSDIMTGHGFRATARTLLDEVLRERIELIEHQLAHTVKDPLGRAYNRTTHLEDRKAMMQRWADYLDGLRDAARERAKGREVK